MKRRGLLLAGFVGAVLAAQIHGAVDASTSTDDEARGKAWWAHVQVLADDSMKGRLTGSPEYLRAAAYVVKQFRADGLAPAGVGGSYYQPVHFIEQWVNAGKSSVG